MRRMSSVLAAAGLVMGLATASSAAAQAGATPKVERYVCGATTAEPKPTAKVQVHGLTPGTLYAEGGFGFDLSTAPATVADGSCQSDKPFFFSVAATDGNYQVTLELGGPKASRTTVRAESRRLMVKELELKHGQTHRVLFTVNVRVPEIAAATTDAAPVSVKLKSREIGALDWDRKLTLEFNGEHPSVRSIEIVRTDSVPTVYIAGDSTVVDQDKEPWAAWGQMLPVFFGPGVAIADEAESGETIKSFVGERRLAKVMSTMKAGDYLMIQFAHNDQKPGSGYVPAETEFKDLLRSYIQQTRDKGATPILVTPMNRRRFGPDGKIVNTLGEYPEAMRQVAAEQKVALIDLNAMSKTLFDTLGEEGTVHAFVHYPANTFPDQPKELKDDTHFNSYGAYELACAIVQSIRDQHLPLEPYLRAGIAEFDPAKPLPFAEWHLPASPFVSSAKPYER